MDKGEVIKGLDEEPFIQEGNRDFAITHAPKGIDHAPQRIKTMAPANCHTTGTR